MESFKFNFNDKEYTLSEGNLEYFQNDEEAPVVGLDLEIVISLLNEKKNVAFSTEYYDLPCSVCQFGKGSKDKFFDYLEYHFYIYTKEGKYVISSISKDFTENTLNNILSSNQIDDSYILSIAVCKNCGSYSMDLGTVHK